MEQQQGGTLSSSDNVEGTAICFKYEMFHALLPQTLEGGKVAAIPVGYEGTRQLLP